MSQQSPFSQNEHLSVGSLFPQRCSDFFLFLIMSQLFNMPGHGAGAASGGPESPDSFTMDSLSRSVDVPGFGDYHSLSPLAQGGSSQLNAFHSVGDAHDHLTLYHFVRDENSAPWNPLKANTGSGPDGPRARQGASLGSNFDLPSFTNFRNTNAPSEFEDSGYYGSMAESMARQSVVDASVSGDTDRGIETQSLIQGVSEFQFQHGQTHNMTSPEGNRQRDAWPPRRAPAPANLDANNMYCSTCNAVLKTKAELK